MSIENKLLREFFAPLLDSDDKLQEIRDGVILKKGTKYFDWTGSGLAHTLVEKRVKKLLPYYANTHSEVSTHSKLMGDVYYKSKEVLKKSLGLDDDFAIFCTGFGATSAIKKFQEILGIYIPSKTKAVLGNLEGIAKPKVLIGPYEHHSNEISWREGLCEVERIGLNLEGAFDIKALQNILKTSKDIKITSFNLASNVTGMLAP